MKEVTNRLQIVTFLQIFEKNDKKLKTADLNRLDLSFILDYETENIDYFAIKDWRNFSVLSDGSMPKDCISASRHRSYTDNASVF
jgi:hypothetical protein